MKKKKIFSFEKKNEEKFHLFSSFSLIHPLNDFLKTAF
jgi:hypothetical protein